LRVKKVFACYTPNSYALNLQTQLQTQLQPNTAPLLSMIKEMRLKRKVKQSNKQALVSQLDLESKKFTAR